MCGASDERLHPRLQRRNSDQRTRRLVGAVRVKAAMHSPAGNDVRGEIGVVAQQFFLGVHQRSHG